MRTIPVKVYNYSELDETAQIKVLNDTVAMFTEMPYEQLSEEMQSAWDKAETMQTPWFVNEYIMEYANTEIMAHIVAFQYRIDGSFECHMEDYRD